MNKVRKFFGQKSALIWSAVAASVAAPSAFAVSATQTAIDTALADGQAMIATIAPGVITIAAIMLGVGLVVNWLRK